MLFRSIREEIAAGFNIPIAIFDPSANRATAEAAQYILAQFGILPRLRKIEEKINEKLLPMFDESGRLFCAFDNPVPEDKTYVLQKRSADITAGVSTINEERSVDGKEPIDGGDEPLVSSLLMPLSQAVAEPEPIPAPLIPGQGPAAGDGNLDDDADKLAMLTLRKLREKLKVAA